MRTHSLVYEGPEFNVWLIEWPPGTGLDWHDHDGSDATIDVLEGILSEQMRAAPHGPTWERFWLPGKRYSMAASLSHKVLNETPLRAVTLHTYSPPLNVEYPEALEIG